MSYAAEPYAQFVDDLLTALTGGTIRDELRFLPEEEPFQLSVAAPVLPKTTRVFGLAGGAYTRFRLGVDYQLDQSAPRAAIVWLPAAAGKAVLHPDDGSTFFVNYEVQGAAPALTDRNTGSVTRILAESFAREYATLSKQLEGVYEAGFLATAKGRDLDQLAALVGIVRRRRLSATGTVVFSRTSPSPADIFIPAGTKLSTSIAPPAVFETTEDRTLQRGALSIDAPVAALAPGDAGVVAANTITVMNRPILGIDDVGNALPTRFAGADETDEGLRARCRRALESAGKATTGSLLGALASLPRIREKDVRIAEDYLTHPGVVNVSIAMPDMADAELAAFSRRALELIDDARPVGIRVHANVSAPRQPGALAAAADDTDAGGAPVAMAVSGGGRFVVDVAAVVTPASSSLSTDERAELTRRAQDAVASFFEEAGVGEVLVYNRLVARLIALDGVVDVDLTLTPREGTAAPRRANVASHDPAAKPVPGTVTVQVGGALIMLDVSVDIHITNAKLGPPDEVTTKQVALRDVLTKLDRFVAQLDSSLNVGLLIGPVKSTDTYEVTALHYTADYVDAGVRIRQLDVELPLSSLERVWIRNISLTSGQGPAPPPPPAPATASLPAPSGGAT